MKVFTFHLRGKMAHFRKYYSNSSALSYFIPPRTTVAGILAGLLGKERDSYYDEFSLDKCRIALMTRTPIKKCMQKLNLLMIKSERDFNGSAEFHSQTATELIIPQNLQKGYIDYQIWISHEDSNIMTQLTNLIRKDFIGYFSKGISVALGTAYNLGWLENGQILEGEEIKGINSLEIDSVIPQKKCKEILLDGVSEGQYRLIKEEVPLEFNQGRMITARGLGDMIINLTGRPVKARVDSCVCLEDGKNIVWME
ncbi:MAG TPA: CRISPR-associated protein Cas5 [Tissierellaceae bacterium]